jgi:thiamine kinase-like enzyme
LAHRDEHYEMNYVVHFDFNPFNILLEHDQVSGVVDWEGSCVSDATFNGFHRYLALAQH